MEVVLPCQCFTLALFFSNIVRISVSRETMGSGSQKWVSQHGKTYVMVGIEIVAYNKLIREVRQTLGRDIISESYKS